MYSSEDDGTFLTQIKNQKEKHYGNNADAVLNDFMHLESESSNIMFVAILIKTLDNLSIE